jgi:DNA-binding transcriptional MocR family regulator
MSAAGSRYLPLVEAYAGRIRDGDLSPGEKLPSVRSLTRLHGVALATAHRIYAELESAGLVIGEVGRGTFVRDTSVHRPSDLRQQSASNTIDLSFNYPTTPGQDALLRDALRALSGRGDIGLLLHSPPQGGRPQDRETAARHLRNRGLRLPAAQVLLVNGAQHGLSVVVQALLRPGDAVAVDGLTYPGFRALAEANRLAVHPVRMADGLTDLDALAALCRRRRLRAVYVMPTLHNPMGSVMPADHRRRLVEIAEQHDLLIIEDGAYAFLAEPAPPPVMTLAPHRTVHVSGLSKSVAAGLRIGFVAAPAAFVPELEEVIRLTVWSAPTLTVALACEWIDSGVVDRLEERKRADARLRQSIARRVLRGHSIASHRASYFLWLGLPRGVRAQAVASELASRGVIVATGDAFASAPQVPQGLRLALGSTPMHGLAPALTQVRDCLPMPM